MKRGYVMIYDELMRDFMPRGCDTSLEAYHHAFRLPESIKVTRVVEASATESLWRMDLAGDGLPDECEGTNRQLTGRYRSVEGEFSELRLEVVK